MLKANGIAVSMTEGYYCSQNALAERINGILKQEFLLYKCNTGKELETLSPESIETYNNKRPSLALGVKRPNFVNKKSIKVNLNALN